LRNPTSRLPRSVKWLAEGVIALILALVMVHLCYTTTAGIALVDAVPDSFWTRYHHAIGTQRSGEVEGAQDADAIIVFLACLVPAGALVAAADMLIRRLRQTP
jgi:hypothetical protein